MFVTIWAHTPQHAHARTRTQGFDKEFDRLLEENKLLKRKLAGTGHPEYAAEVSVAAGGGKKDD